MKIRKFIEQKSTQKESTSKFKKEVKKASKPKQTDHSAKTRTSPKSKRCKASSKNKKPATQSEQAIQSLKTLVITAL
jgi:hypothetical protein